MEYTNLTKGYAAIIGAIIAAILLLILAVKFIFFKGLLKNDLAHPVVGSVIPTFAMASMVVSNTIGKFLPILGDTIWVLMVCLHLVFLAVFVFHRIKNFELCHMIPSWFVPPVGIIVADVSFSGNIHISFIANFALILGLVSYAMLLPLMMYRLILADEIPDSSKPTIAILAAPASLSLAGYLNIMQEPSPIIIALLFGISILMTVTVYLLFGRLFKLSFSPGYAAFTFPMVIGSIALFKLSIWMNSLNLPQQYVSQIYNLALFELIIATFVVTYVSIRYLNFYEPAKVTIKR